MTPCPPDWKGPGCSCSLLALEPKEYCWVHGWPDRCQCPYCGQMRGRKACKRCGCTFGLNPAYLQVTAAIEEIFKETP